VDHANLNLFHAMKERYVENLVAVKIFRLLSVGKMLFGTSYSYTYMCIVL